MTAAPGRDEEAYNELKRILSQRIEELENGAPTHPHSTALKTVSSAD
jgi:hypothetical protein